MATEVPCYFYRHVAHKNNRLSPYDGDTAVFTKNMMKTMEEMGAGQPSLSLLTSRNRDFLVHFVALSSIMITTNSVGYTMNLLRTYMKPDMDTPGRMNGEEKPTNHQHDGLINKIFPPDGTYENQISTLKNLKATPDFISKASKLSDSIITVINFYLRSSKQYPCSYVT